MSRDKEASVGFIREPRPMKPQMANEESMQNHKRAVERERDAMGREGKWTPGPWKLESGNKGPVISFAGWPLALVVNTRPDYQANARLIAAAPAMAEALREILLQVPTGPVASICYAALRAAGVE